MINRVIWIVLDSLGMGEMPDAERYGDKGTNTLGNIARVRGELAIPHMRELGLGNIEGMRYISPVDKPLGAYGRLAEVSAGKDTTTGHWEMTGIYSPKPFPVFPHGFSGDILDRFTAETGVPGILGNFPASGTEIINRLGNEHMKLRYPIIYTSADSVFQIACHEDIYPLESLYKMCRVARKLLTGRNGAARVIARPFIGENGNFTRTSNRRDFSLKPSSDNLLVRMKDAGLDVIAVGKIEDIFANVGITQSIHTNDNMDGVVQTISLMQQENKGLIFTNLVDFDMKWGHRNDVEGYAKALEEFDRVLPDIRKAMKKEDLLILTADHGCDPTTPGTDHTREYVPLLICGDKVKEDVDLKTGKTFANIGQTVADIFGMKPLAIGESLKDKLLKE